MLAPSDPAAAGPGSADRDGAGQGTTFFSASPRAPASSAESSTTRRPPPSSGTRMTIPRPSLVTSSGPSPVRGFMAAMLFPFLVGGAGLPRRAAGVVCRDHYRRPLARESPSSASGASAPSGMVLQAAR